MISVESVRIFVAAGEAEPRGERRLFGVLRAAN
jgi:hypothetical protein